MLCMLHRASQSVVGPGGPPDEEDDFEDIEAAIAALEVSFDSQGVQGDLGRLTFGLVLVASPASLHLATPLLRTLRL